MRLLVVLLIASLVSACASDPITSRREGQTIVCHKNKESITVSNAALFNHMDHGDTMGPCANGK